MIPFIQKEVVQNKKWLSEKDILDVVSIAETTPGPIAINAATFVGYRVAGFLGALMSTLGVVLPSFVIILLISFFFREFMNYPIVENAFWGVRIAVLALMVKAFISLFKQSKKIPLTYVIMVLALLAVVVFDVNVLYVILTSALIGIIYQTLKVRKEGK